MRSARRSAAAWLLVLPILPLVLGTPANRAGAADENEPETVHYGIEINGTLCGYSTLKTSTVEVKGRRLIRIEHRVFAMLSALGSRFNSEIDLTYLVDPATGQFTYHDSEITQGQTHLTSKVVVEGDTVRFTYGEDDPEVVVTLHPGVIRPNTLFLPHLKADFVDRDLPEKTYEILEVREAEIQKTTYRRTGAEELTLAGRTYKAVVLDSVSLATGLKATTWIDAGTGRILKAVRPGRRAAYLTDASVVKRIELANLDESLARKTNVRIADIKAISYMKVRVKIEPTGLWVTPENLNVPGQKFTGTVKENLVSGVFEVEHARYDGEAAPPFPPRFSDDPALAPHLESGQFIRPDDPVLAKRARQITEGSKDSWEAARRLSHWVAENIDYAIPGGGTARKTHDTRAGECGAHSILLATFCRSVGIPARVIWGCMYIPNFGGAFGQHAWNEIYMGEAGWIPVDATAFETDYVDSGHIRLGELDATTISLNALEMEVLDHRLGTGEAEAAAADRYSALLGDYTHPRRGLTVKVVVQDGGLAVDIPNKVVLALSDADDEGRWVAKLSPKVYCTFVKDEAGKVAELQIHELVRLRRTADPEEVGETVPEALRPYLGGYTLSARNAVFTVICRDGLLAVDDPLAKKVVGLKAPDSRGRFLDEFGKNTIYFERDENGKVERMVIDAVSRFKR